MKRGSVLRIGTTLTGQELVEYQKLSARHVAFSLTEACPLRCAHCIVSTVAASDTTRTMPLDRARSYALQLRGLRERGVNVISLTGGEPFLAQPQMRVLSEAAAQLGMHCGVTTACPWAGSDESAERTISAFPGITQWDISTDIFHKPYVSVQNIKRAAAAVLRHGRSVTVRMAVTVPLSDRANTLHDKLRSELPPEVQILAQPTIQSGRGADVGMQVETAQAPAWPCIPGCLLVHYDGSFAPCCAGLAYEKTNHPFQYANVDVLGLAEAHSVWCTDPLLQLIRTVGFEPVLGWVREVDADNEVLKATPRHPCECCVQLWKNPSLGAKIRERAERPENRVKIAELTRVVLGEEFIQLS